MCPTELEVCRLWEYARESKTIRDLCARTFEAADGDQWDTAARHVVRGEFYQLFDHLGRASILFQKGIYGFEGNELAEGFSTPFPRPWNRLSADQRKVLCATANWSAKDLAAIPVFRRAEMPHVTALVALFKPASIEEVFGKGRVSVSDYYHSGEKLRRICPNLLRKNGSELLVVKIDWGEATNEELVAAFAEWVKENNPPGLQRPDGRGRRKANVRAALEWLGMMRLLHAFTKSEMTHRVPDAVRRFGSRDWYRDRKRAGGVFRELFPFLPAGEGPLSWQTKGSRTN